MEKKNLRKDQKTQIVAAFDFDGTLTKKDSFLPFLVYTTGRTKTLWNLTIQLPSLAFTWFKTFSRQQAKEKILSRFYKGTPFQWLEEQGKQFGTKQLPSYIDPKAIKRFYWHRNQGHCCILISASLEVYLRPFGKEFGFDHVLASKLEIDSEGKITGNLLGANCRREEKVRRLIELLGPKENYQLYAYGDSKGDKELLQIADHPYYQTMS